MSAPLGGSGKPAKRTKPTVAALRAASAEVWDLPAMREHLATHDLAQVFHLLQSYGWSQRKIAAMTGQSQSEISEILSGRQVTSYPVLVRMCEGFGLPRGWLGLAYTPTASKVDIPVPVGGPRLRIAVSVEVPSDDPLGWPSVLRQALASLDRGAHTP